MLAKKQAPDRGGGFDEPIERLMLKMDAATFSKLQRSDAVRLRVFCPENGASLNFLLKDMNSKKDGMGMPMVVDVNLDNETFMSIVNPKLVVVFQFANVLCPFATVAMGRGCAFSDVTPMIEPAN